jgi:hypothetical protein
LVVVQALNITATAALSRVKRVTGFISKFFIWNFYDVGFSKFHFDYYAQIGMTGKRSGSSNLTGFVNKLCAVWQQEEYVSDADWEGPGPGWSRSRSVLGLSGRSIEEFLF